MTTWKIDERAIAEIVALVEELRAIDVTRTEQINRMVAIAEQLQVKAAKWDAVPVNALKRYYRHSFTAYSVKYTGEPLLNDERAIEGWLNSLDGEA